jgi:hypothetical protein
VTDEELDLYLEALGSEMRPLADLIVRLKAEHAEMPANSPLGRKAKFAMAKVIQHHEDDFARLFNRDDCFERYVWPDGLTVRFAGSPEVRTREGRRFARNRRIRPMFSRNGA